ncbi:uncharacterized protein LOC124120716 [Haliotis rufescens]|uniref:uncharacterized protein LOC124120716 n=1 Tax=Haliotis rufescens TaxID=6454 RepID=UPI00201E917F|nr:uncharacterized protein LOC124120716 [Haliotis rufescens]
MAESVFIDVEESDWHLTSSKMYTLMLEASVRGLQKARMKHIFIFVAVICLPHVSGEDACPCVTGYNCPENCTLVNIAPQATSNFTSGDNNTFSITGQAAWVTDGVTSGSCASVSSLHPAWKAEFGLTRTVNGIKIFWEGTENGISN